jgi:hypothetical protein
MKKEEEKRKRIFGIRKSVFGSEDLRVLKRTGGRKKRYTPTKRYGRSEPSVSSTFIVQDCEPNFKMEKTLLTGGLRYFFWQGQSRKMEQETRTSQIEGGQFPNPITLEAGCSSDGWDAVISK